VLHGLLLAAENPPQAASGPGALASLIAKFYDYLFGAHPLVGVLVGLVVSAVAAFVVAKIAARMQRTKLGWGTCAFLLCVLFFILPLLPLLSLPTWARHRPVILVIGLIILIISLISLIIVPINFIVDRRRRTHKTKTGTAQVLSVETMTKTEGLNPRCMCRFALRVEIPGRPTYVTLSRPEFMTPEEIAAMQPGKTVAVRVDTANPQNVSIDS